MVPTTSTSAVGVWMRIGRPAGWGRASIDSVPCRSTTLLYQRAANSSIDSPVMVTAVPSSNRNVRKADSPSRLTMPALSLWPTARLESTEWPSLHEAAPSSDATSTIASITRGDVAEAARPVSPSRSWINADQPIASVNSPATASDPPTTRLRRASLRLPMKAR